MISILLRIEKSVGHKHVRMFIGPDREHRAMSGLIVFDHAQYDAFEKILKRGIETLNAEWRKTVRATLDVEDINAESEAQRMDTL